jgi:hypothetical protein
MPRRLIIAICIFFSIFLLPWWCSLIIFCIGIFAIERWYEGLAFALFYDLLYGVPEMRFYGFIFVATLLASVLFVVAEFLKTKLRSYST